MRERSQSQVDREWLSTLHEMFPNGGTYNHAWNAPNTILSKYIAGIAPTKPGWSEYQILPNMEQMASIEQVVPSVKGDIKVSLSQKEHAFSLELDSPTGTVAVIGIPKSIGALDEVRANDQTLWQDGQFIGKGDQVLQAGENEKYLLFRVAPGVCKISATAR
jgi:hypothetical protein